jgi:hypothetical protein
MQEWGWDSLKGTGSIGMAELQYKAELDLLQAEECVGRKAHLVMTADVRGHIVGVWTRLGSRAYNLEWVVEGAIHNCDFYGFQLELED